MNKDILEILRFSGFGAPSSISVLTADISINTIGRQERFNCTIQGEYGTLEGFETRQGGPVTLPGAPFEREIDFVIAAQNWLNENAAGGSQAFFIENQSGGNTIIFNSDLEFLNIRNVVQNTFALSCTPSAARNTSIDVTGAQNVSFLRISVDKGNDGTREYIGDWVANNPTVNFDISPSVILIEDGDKIYIEGSQDGANVSSQKTYFIPDTTFFQIDDAANYAAVLISFSGEFDGNAPAYILQYGTETEIINPADISYAGYSINLVAAGIAQGENFGLTITAAYNSADAAPGNNGLIGESNPYRLLYAAPAPDIEAPTAPSNLVGANTSYNSVDLFWTASADNTAVSEYIIYREAQEIARVNGNVTNYQATGLSPETTFNFVVSAIDAAGNQSPASNTLAVTTTAAPDTAPPSAPGGASPANTTANSVELNWTASADNVEVTEYAIFQDGEEIAQVDGNTLTYQVTGLSPETTYQFRIRARDAAGNQSAYSVSQNITTTAFVDSEAPTAPVLASSNQRYNEIDLTWTSASDNVGVTEYAVVRGSFVIEVLAANVLSYTAGDLVANSPYEFRVIARDAAGNETDSNTLQVSTAQDTEAPTAPIGLTASNETTTQITLSWIAASDNVGVTEYGVFVDNLEVAQVAGNLLSYQATGLTPNTNYTFKVVARDAAGNQGPDSNEVSRSTQAAADTQAPTAPGSLAGSSPSGSQVDLTWTASSDNVGVTKYLIYRDGQEIAQVDGNTLNFTVLGLSPSTAYAFKVAAQDAAENQSADSNIISVTTSSSVFSMTFEDSYFQVTDGANSYRVADIRRSRFDTTAHEAATVVQTYTGSGESSQAFRDLVELAKLSTEWQNGEIVKIRINDGNYTANSFVGVTDSRIIWEGQSRENTVIDAAGFDMGYYRGIFDFEGNKGTQQTLTANIVEGERKIYVQDNTDFEIGQFAFISKRQQPARMVGNHAKTNDPNFFIYGLQIVEVESKSSDVGGDYIVLEAPALFDVDFTQGYELHATQFITDNGVMNMTLIQSQFATEENNRSLVHFRYNGRFFIKDVNFECSLGHYADPDFMSKFVMEGCNFNDGHRRGSGGGRNYVVLRHLTYGHIENCTATFGRHLSIQEYARVCYVGNCSFSGMDINFHYWLAGDTVFENNTFNDLAQAVSKDPNDGAFRNIYGPIMTVIPNENTGTLSSGIDNRVTLYSNHIDGTVHGGGIFLGGLEQDLSFLYNSIGIEGLSYYQNSYHDNEFREPALVFSVPAERVKFIGNDFFIPQGKPNTWAVKRRGTAFNENNDPDVSLIDNRFYNFAPSHRIGDDPGGEVSGNLFLEAVNMPPVPGKPVASIRAYQLANFPLESVDTQAPTAPGSLAGSNETNTTIDLSWNASTDDTAVTEYAIFRDGQEIAQVAGNVLTYQATGLSASTSYDFKIVARDAAGNQSLDSNTVSVSTTSPDTQAPTAPGSLGGSNETVSSVDLSWTASTDDTAVTEYAIFRDGQEIAQVAGNVLTYQATGLNASTEYDFKIVARDAAGNFSPDSNTVSITTTAPAGGLPTTGLIAHHKFDSASTGVAAGQTVMVIPDLSGNNRTLTTSGAIQRADRVQYDGNQLDAGGTWPTWAENTGQMSWVFAIQHQDGGGARFAHFGGTANSIPIGDYSIGFRRNFNQEDVFFKTPWIDRENTMYIMTFDSDGNGEVWRHLGEAMAVWEVVAQNFTRDEMYQNRELQYIKANGADLLLESAFYDVQLTGADLEQAKSYLAGSWQRQGAPLNYPTSGNVLWTSNYEAATPGQAFDEAYTAATWNRLSGQTRQDGTINDYTDTNSVTRRAAIFPISATGAGFNNGHNMANCNPIPQGLEEAFLSFGLLVTPNGSRGTKVSPFLNSLDTPPPNNDPSWNEFYAGFMTREAFDGDLDGPLNQMIMHIYAYFKDHGAHHLNLYDQNGTWVMPFDTFNDITLRMKMNTPGQPDGILQAWVNGRLAASDGSIEFRDDINVLIERMSHSVFDGGDNGGIWQSGQNKNVVMSTVTVRDHLHFTPVV